MAVLEWFIVMLVAGTVLTMLVAVSRGRRRMVWCPERAMLAEVETETGAYAMDPGDRSIVFCSLWSALKGSSCNRQCTTRLARERTVPR